MIHASLLPDVEVPDVPLTEYVLFAAEDLGDKPALVDGPSGRTLTYAQLSGAVRSLAGGLVAHPFAKGEVVGLMAPNLPEFAVVFHGVAMAGGVITTINPTCTEREVHHQLLDSNARLLITVAPCLDVVVAAVVGTGVSEIYVIGDTPEGSDARPLSELMGPPLAEQVPVTPDDLVVLPYSSGTTGLNKGVMLTHRNLIANIAQVLVPAEVRRDEKFIAVLPFFHIYGMQVLMNTGLRAGATIITMPRFDLEQFLQLHVDHRITRSFVAPPIVVALAKHPLVDSYDLSALEQVFSGAAPLSAELALEAGTRLGLRGGAGLRHDRDVPGVPPDAPRAVQAGFARADRTQHRAANRGPHLRAGPRGRRRWRAVDPRSAGDEGLPEQPDGDRQHSRCRQLAAHGRHRAHRCRRARVRRGQAEGADQVQGLPGATRRAGGAAAHSPGRCGRRRRRPPGRGGR
jgi:acyl-CoA synthetase (AMP-forming)/AMP-acid ligase II